MMCPQSMEDVQCSVSENSQVCIGLKTWQKWKPAPLLFPGWDTLGDMFAGMVCLIWHGVIVPETCCTTFRTFHPLHQCLGQEQWPWFSLCAFLCCKRCEPLKACHWLSYDSSLATNEGGANSFQVPSVVYGICASVLSSHSNFYQLAYCLQHVSYVCTQRGFSCNMSLEPINEYWIGNCLKIYVNWPLMVNPSRISVCKCYYLLNISETLHWFSCLPTCRRIPSIASTSN